jgi:hypothetical protein
MRRILLLRIRNVSVPADILNMPLIRTSPLRLVISSSHRELFVLFPALRKEDLIPQRKKVQRVFLKKIALVSPGLTGFVLIRSGTRPSEQ